jgi:Ca2+-transporting ATPase
VTFLGASIFNIVGGVPFLPLQTFWVNFTTQVFQAIGLGYGKEREGLMRRKPRDPEQPILTRPLLVWLAIAGFVMGAGTLGVIWWAADHRTEEIARTMGLVTFSLMNLFFSFAARDEERSIFSFDFLEDRKFMMFSGLSIAAIVLGTELRVLQKILDTVSLTFHQWLVCIVVALAIVVASEARALLLRRQRPTDTASEEVAGGEMGPVTA